MNNEPEPLVTDYLMARSARDEAQERFAEIETRLIKQMEADQRKSYRWSDGKVNHNLTIVTSSTTQIDEPGLRKALTARVFDRYTKKVLDRPRMEAAMDTNEVDRKVVARFVRMVPRKPYLKHAVRNQEEK